MALHRFRDGAASMAIVMVFQENMMGTENRDMQALDPLRQGRARMLEESAGIRIAEAELLPQEIKSPEPLRPACALADQHITVLDDAS